MAHCTCATRYHDRSLLRWTSLILSSVQIYCCWILWSRNGHLYCHLASSLCRGCIYRGSSRFVVCEKMFQALSDFCTRGDKYIRQHIGKDMIETMVFYNKCDEHPTHDNVPPSLQANNISNLLTDIQVTKTKLDVLLDKTFNHSEIVKNLQ